MARRYPCLVNVRLSLRSSSELTRAAARVGLTGYRERTEPYYCSVRGYYRTSWADS